MQAVHLRCFAPFISLVCGTSKIRLFRIKYGKSWNETMEKNKINNWERDLWTVQQEYNTLQRHIRNLARKDREIHVDEMKKKQNQKGETPSMFSHWKDIAFCVYYLHVLLSLPFLRSLSSFMSCNISLDDILTVLCFLFLSFYHYSMLMYPFSIHYALQLHFSCIFCFGDWRHDELSPSL